MVMSKKGFFHLRVLMAACMAGMAAASCTAYRDLQVAASYRVSALSIDPATGTALDAEQVLATILPESGDQYLQVQYLSSSASSPTGGIALLSLSTYALADSSNTVDYYRHSGYLERAVVLEEGRDPALLLPPYGSACIGGDECLIIANSQLYRISPEDGFLPTGESCQTAFSGWLIAWKDALGSGVGAAGGRSSPEKFTLDGVGIPTPSYDEFAASSLALDGEGGILAPYHCYSLDPLTGKTMAALALGRVDIHEGLMSEYGRFPAQDDPGIRCLCALPEGILGIEEGGGCLVARGLDGAELRRTTLEGWEKSGSMLTGNRPGQGLLFAPPALRPYSQDDLDSTGLSCRYSLFSAAGERLWSVDLGNSDSRFLTAFWLDSRILIIRIQAVGLATVTEEYIMGI